MDSVDVCDVIVLSLLPAVVAVFAERPLLFGLKAEIWRKLATAGTARLR